MLDDLISPAQQLLFEYAQHVAAQAGDGLAAEGEALTVKTGHCPGNKGKAHGDGLSASDSSIINDAVVVVERTLRRPPDQRLHLLLTERFPLERLCSTKSAHPRPPPFRHPVPVA